MFGNRRSFGELLHRSEEGIASNILAGRLERLTAAGAAQPAGRPLSSAEAPAQPDESPGATRTAMHTLVLLSD